MTSDAKILELLNGKDSQALAAVVADTVVTMPEWVLIVTAVCNDVDCVTLPLDIFNPPLIVVFDPVMVMALVNVPAVMTLTSIAAVSAVRVSVY